MKDTSPNARRITESPHPDSENLDQMTTAQILCLMNQEDRGIADAVALRLGRIEEAVVLVAECIQKGGRLYYLGSGTSGRLGAVDAVEWRPTFGVPKETAQAVISGGIENALLGIETRGREDADATTEINQQKIGAGDVAIGISASGSTPYVCSGLDAARQNGARTVLLCFSPPPADLNVDLVLLVETGPEILTGSTRLKAGTATKMILNMISTAAMVRCGAVYGNLMTGVIPDNAKLQTRALGIIQEITKASKDRCLQALESGGRVPEAVLMIKGNLSLEQAKQLLQKHEGRLRNALATLV